MQETITLTLPKDIRSALDDLTHREGISPDDLIFDRVCGTGRWADAVCAAVVDSDAIQ